MMFSPDMLAMKPSTNCESLVLFSSTVSFSPSTGVPVKAPANGSQMLSIWLVTMSSWLMPSGVMERNAGASWGWPLRPPTCIL